MIPVSAQEISSKFVLPARFAQIAYYPSDLLQAWGCSNPCKALGLGSFTPLTVGGGADPTVFAGHDNQTQNIVVAHQGTDSTKALRAHRAAPPIPFSLQSSQGCRTRYSGTSSSQDTALAGGCGLGHSHARQHLDPTISINTIVFAPPRVCQSHRLRGTLAGVRMGRQYCPLRGT
ncbi:hypothetical protein EDB89DRAFT_2105867 [Lactarius sanguifluus]|nr:hypothetical protein EDB89DRAFT_2105867 [Lactarius sanguifluus]